MFNWFKKRRPAPPPPPEPEPLSPSEYFSIVKSKKQTITDEDLTRYYDNCLDMINKYQVTGQRTGLRKLLFHIECVEREREIVKLGINTFIYRDDIEEYIDTVAKNVVKIIELENYEREIPDDVVALIEKVKGKFDKLYIVFTDYTGKVERQVEKARRAKDPILFGTFQNSKSRVVVDRFYFIADWEDEFCDLTLDKLVHEMQASKKRNVTRTINTPTDIEDLKKQLGMLSPKGDAFVIGPGDIQ